MDTLNSINTDNYSPRNDVEVKLVELFTAKLNITSVGVHKSFFFLGGNKELAKSLLQDINHAFDLNLQLKDLTKNNTVAQLAKVVGNGNKKLNSLVIPLNKNKDDSTPSLFFICGIALYGMLAKNLSKSYACYGIYVPEEEGFFKNHENDDGLSIPDLAAIYIKAIIKHSPNGPYTIAGVSFGGVLAFEIARQLEQANQKVAGLIILDAVLPGALKRNWKLKIRSLLGRLHHLIFKPSFNLENKKQKQKPGNKDQSLGNERFLTILKGKATVQYFNSKPVFNRPTLIIRATNEGPHQPVPDLCWTPKLEGPIILAKAPGTHLEILQSETTANFITTYICPKQ